MVAQRVSLRDVFIDSSVILSALIDFGARSAGALQLFEAIASGRDGPPKTAWHCCLEVYSVATRLPEEFRLKPLDAVKLLESELLARFDVLELPLSGRHAFLTQCGREGVRGGRLYDAHIAAVARASKAKLVVTENRRDFIGLEREGIRVAGAAEAIAVIAQRRKSL